eukprot:jgi/Mesen1/729/ME000011S00069
MASIASTSGSVLLQQAAFAKVQGGSSSSSFNGASISMPLARKRVMSPRVTMAIAAPSAVPQQHKLKLGETVRVGVLGASGYTGAEIVRLLATHPFFSVTLMTADRKAGQALHTVFPHLMTQSLPNMVAVKDADFDQVDAVFCCLPHGTTQEIIAALPKHLKVVDLSADFRLRDTDEYEVWYKGQHRAPELQKEAVYGLTEVYREQVREARLVANPGCYPTTVQLPLIPLFQGGLIERDGIIIDAKSGVSGAGRGAKESNLYTEIAEGINSYGLTNHRHVPEIEQGLAEFAGGAVTPQCHCLVNLVGAGWRGQSRGMQSTIYAQMKPGVSVADIRNHLTSRFHDEEFVNVLPEGGIPSTRMVRGSNYCVLAVFPDRIPGRVIIISVIDNLVKGASGQALQNLNIMMGAPEDCGLLQQPMFP